MSHHSTDTESLRVGKTYYSIHKNIARTATGIIANIYCYVIVVLVIEGDLGLICVFPLIEEQYIPR